MKRMILSFSFLSLFWPAVHAEVKTPVMEVILEKILAFAPGKEFNQDNFKKTYPDLQKYAPQAASQIFRASIPSGPGQIRFFIFFQVLNGKITNFFTRLPAYFSHDFFLASLQKKYQKQNKFFKKERSALYVWNNADGLKLTYNGNCTITCFTGYLSGEYANPPAEVAALPPFLQIFSLIQVPQ